MNEDKNKLIDFFCNEPREITILNLRDFVGRNSFIIFHSSILYKKYKDKRLLDLAKLARENKNKFENLNIADIEEISKCCYESRRLYILFKILRKELESNEINIL